MKGLPLQALLKVSYDHLTASPVAAALETASPTAPVHDLPKIAWWRPSVRPWCVLARCPSARARLARHAPVPYSVGTTLGARRGLASVAVRDPRRRRSSTGTERWLGPSPRSAPSRHLLVAAIAGWQPRGADRRILTMAPTAVIVPCSPCTSLGLAWMVPFAHMTIERNEGLRALHHHFPAEGHHRRLPVLRSSSAEPSRIQRNKGRPRPPPEAGPSPPPVLLEVVTCVMGATGWGARGYPAGVNAIFNLVVDFGAQYAIARRVRRIAVYSVVPTRERGGRSAGTAHASCRAARPSVYERARPPSTRDLRGRRACPGIFTASRPPAPPSAAPWCTEPPQMQAPVVSADSYLFDGTPTARSWMITAGAVGRRQKATVYLRLPSRPSSRASVASYGLRWHPEVGHSQFKPRVKNFTRGAGLEPVDRRLHRGPSRSREDSRAGRRRAGHLRPVRRRGLLRGAAAMHKAVGDQLTCFFIDHDCCARA